MTRNLEVMQVANGKMRETALDNNSNNNNMETFWQCNIKVLESNIS